MADAGDCCVIYKKCMTSIMKYLNISSVNFELFHKGFYGPDPGGMKTYQRIEKECEHQGSVKASELFLTEVMMKKHDSESFYKFIDTLKATEQTKLASELLREYEGRCPSTPKDVNVDDLPPSRAPIREEQADESNDSDNTGAYRQHHWEDVKKPVQEAGGEQQPDATAQDMALAASGEHGHQTNVKQWWNASQNVPLAGNQAENHEYPETNLNSACYSELHSIPPPATDKSTDNSGSVSKPFPHLKDSSFFKIKPENLGFHTKNLIGVGQYGNVYRCNYGGTDVAVKQINLEINEGVENFVKKNKELRACFEVRHESIVQFIGYSTGKVADEVYPLLVFVLVDGWNLHTLLHRKDENGEEFTLTKEVKHKMAKQLTEAITYLHGNQLRMIHGDIKPKNVMITRSFDVKVCDLGLSKIKRDGSISSTVGKARGTPYYMAPELLLEEQPVSFMSDMFSLGVTLYEVFAKESMWPNFTDSEDVKEQLKQKMRERYIPLNLKEQRHEQPYKIIAQCVSYQPKERPDADKVLDVMKKIAEDQ